MKRAIPSLCGALTLLVLPWVAGSAVAAGEGQEIRSPLPDCERRGTVTTCRLPFPESGSPELYLDVAVAEVTAFRLYAGSGGYRRLVTAGRWHPSPAVRHSIAVTQPSQGGPLRGPVLHLELYGTSRPPRLLAYGPRGPEPATVPRREAVPPLPPLPEKAKARSPLEDLDFQASWTVRAAGAAPGDVARLEIPPEVYAESRQWYLVDLRLAVGDEQIPYEIDSADVSRLSASARLKAAPGSAPGWSRFEVPGLAPGLPFTSLHLTAPPRPISRQVFVADMPGVPWTCRPEPPLPCRLSMDLLMTEEMMKRSVHPRKLTIAVQDGEEAPLADLTAKVWTRPDALLFVWPERQPVRLLIGSDERKGPYFSLSSLDPEIRERPAKPASVERRARAGLDPRALAVASFAAAGLVLLGLLALEARRQRVALLLLLAALPARGAAAAPGEDGAFFTRPVEVPAAGWVRVPLEPEALRHLGPDGRRARAIGPGGEELPVVVETPGESGFDDTIWKAQVLQQEGRSWYRIDLGQSPPLHDHVSWRRGWRDAAGTLPEASLESSDDGEAWKTLDGTASLRLAPDIAAGVQLVYPATRSRYLRVSLPPEPYGAGATFELAVHRPAGEGGRSLRTVPLTPLCRQEKTVAVCHIELPGAGQLPAQLHLDLATGGAAGFRLYRAESGRWRLLAEGLWAAAAPGRRRIPIATEGRLASDLLRLELYGAAGPPRLSGAAIDLVVPSAWFQASQAGLHSLIYGGGAPWEEGPGPYVPQEMVVAGVDPGPETAHPLPPLPAGTVSPGRPLRDFRRSVSWEIRAPGARQGEVVRLEVPVEAYLRAGALERLRLETGGRQIPFVQWVPPEPARELAGTSLRPLAARPGFPGQPPHSRLGISIPETPFELTSFEVTSWSALNVSGGSWNPPGGQGSWDCRPAVALPCRLEAGPRDPRSGGTEIELDVGDSAAKPGITLWRPRQALVFVWPASGPVRLVAGDESVAAPRYDLAALADQLLIRPWKPALAGPAEDLSAGDVVPPGLRLGGLALAAVALLGLIYKMLPPA